ncbi:hypothetical protein SRB5_68130 [Streptomyces sp. RB5]|uniref:Tetratricopeptide repeat protein n=1 Tax=Streptomyces smaragdinus TaxID=2585196 RepID=A0A7K0CT31_9ACTN|nr:hypothetical protein [Streptomyces smaragdinus]
MCTPGGGWTERSARGGWTRASGPRAEEGDRYALYCLLRLLCETDRIPQARQVVRDLGPDNPHAHEIVDGYSTADPAS